MFERIVSVQHKYCRPRKLPVERMYVGSGCRLWKVRGTLARLITCDFPQARGQWPQILQSQQVKELLKILQLNFGDGWQSFSVPEPQVHLYAS